MVDPDRTVSTNGHPHNGARREDASTLSLRSAAIAAVASGRDGGTRLGLAGVGTPRPVVNEIRRSLLRAILANRAIHAAYQSVVSLDTREAVGFEALARGPRRSILEQPDALLKTAEAAGCLEELDWMCRGAAVKGALAARLDPSLLLLVNVHPRALDASVPDDLVDLMQRGASELSLVAELTEAALASRPAALLRVLASVRDRGFGIALGDVGGDPRMLSLLPLVRPDVIKLNLRVLEQRPEPEVAALLAAVNEQCERTGGALLAEGIETEAHLTAARALGATLGQGYLFGRPGRLPMRLGRPEVPVDLGNRARMPGGQTPFEVVSAVRRVRSGNQDLVQSLARLVESQAISLVGGGIVLGSFPRPDLFTSEAQRRWAHLAEDTLVVGVFAPGMRPQPAPGVPGVAIDPEDPLAGEWSVVVIAPGFAAALVAAEQPGLGPDGRPRFDVALTHDRELVAAAGASLLRRVAGEKAAR